MPGPYHRICIAADTKNEAKKAQKAQKAKPSKTETIPHDQRSEVEGADYILRIVEEKRVIWR